MKNLKNLLEKVKNNKVSINDALQELKNLPFKDLGFAKIDNHREIRTGYPEVIYSENKTVYQIERIIETILENGNNLLATRLSEKKYFELKEKFPEAKYNSLGKTLTIKNHYEKMTESYIAIVAAGTSDLPVVEEAAETAQIFHNKIVKIVDVGVSGIHRLFSHLDKLRKAKVIIAIAGMEGALPSVLAGLVEVPIIAVPTSVGYGTNLKGISALLTMLNSCANGITVVNIDNGFGAAYSASLINKS